MSSAEASMTPVMKQYWELKSQVPGAILFFRLGDFYEFFGDDAVQASKLLEITLTSRDKNKSNPLPMAGVPHHSAQSYIQKLLNSGYKVAIAEQVESNDPTSKIALRKIVRVLTPGVQFDSESNEPNFLAAFIPLPATFLDRSMPKGTDKSKVRLGILACLDASTGETLVSTALSYPMLGTKLNQLPIRHLLYLEKDSELIPSSGELKPTLYVESLPSNYLSHSPADDLLNQQYEVGDLPGLLGDLFRTPDSQKKELKTTDPLGEKLTESGIFALAVVVRYALRSQHLARMPHLRLPEPLQRPTCMILGPNTTSHLDLPDVFHLVNHTQTTLGSRQLRRWLWAPLLLPSEILARQTAAQMLCGFTSAEVSRTSESHSDTLSHALARCYDLERIMGRIHTRLANPKDTLALGLSLGSIPSILDSLKPLMSEKLSTQEPKSLVQQISIELTTLNEDLISLAQKITQFQINPAPINSRDGGIFGTGLSEHLDRLLELTKNGQNFLVELEARERAQTGIANLKIRYNRVFGYFIEISQAHLKSVPAHYQRKQTMVGAERFFTDELKSFEVEILTASTRQKDLEAEMFLELISEIQQKTNAIMKAARLIGSLDALCSLGACTQLPGWCFPSIDESTQMDIVAGRHPLVDRQGRGDFVPNHLNLDPKSRLTLLITGPNMGGKSTVMRQNALIVILGQAGFPVPAKQASWGSVSSVYTRIGAQDLIASGQSTFMVEMSELAHILHYSDHRSLILLDEIGRGTSTYDGMSVAWATLEWISSQIRARTLFATHYHELTRLASELPGVANAHMAVEGGTRGPSGISGLRFLYQLKEGPTNDSYGIHVAQLAGLPKAVVQRAWNILGDLEAQASTHRKQLSLFDLPTSDLTEEFDPQDSSAWETPAAEPTPIHPLVTALEQVDLNQLTPIQALTTLAQMKEQALKELA